MLNLGTVFPKSTSAQFSHRGGIAQVLGEGGREIPRQGMWERDYDTRHNKRGRQQKKNDTLKTQKMTTKGGAIIDLQ
jgi:hypothetical protein